MEVVIGKGAKRPIKLDTPILIGAMSFGSLSIEAKVALALGAKTSECFNSLRHRLARGKAKSQAGV